MSGWWWLGYPVLLAIAMAVGYRLARWRKQRWLARIAQHNADYDRWLAAQHAAWDAGTWKADGWDRAQFPHYPVSG